jgi:hypothetical protein
MHTDVSRPRLAAVVYERGFDIDSLTLGDSDVLRLRSITLGALLQSSSGGCAQSVLMADLRSGDVFDIWDRRGNGACGCRLDDVLLDTEPALRTAITDRIDLVVVNRFGRAETLGRGSRQR